MSGRLGNGSMFRGTSPQNVHSPHLGLRREAIQPRDKLLSQEARSATAVLPAPSHAGEARAAPHAASIGTARPSEGPPVGQRFSRPGAVSPPSMSQASQLSGTMRSRPGLQPGLPFSTPDAGRAASAEMPGRSSQFGVAKADSASSVRARTPPSSQQMSKARPDLIEVSPSSQARGPSEVSPRSLMSASTARSRREEITDAVSRALGNCSESDLRNIHDIPGMAEALMHCRWDGSPPASANVPPALGNPDLERPVADGPQLQWHRGLLQEDLAEKSRKEMPLGSYVRNPSAPPSEAASSSAVQSFVRYGGNDDSERLSVEERLRKLENSLDEKLIRVTSEAMNASVTLCRAAEDRFAQQLESLRSELLREVSQLQQQVTSAAQQAAQACATASSTGIDRINEELPSSGMEGMRSDLFQELHQTISQEVSTLRFELASRGIPVTAGLPSMPELEALAPLVGQGEADTARKTGIAGLVGVISDCVIERIKEDDSIKSGMEQQDQLKAVILELRNLPSSFGQSDPGRKSNELENLHGMVKEMVKISYSLAQEISSERDQRGRMFSEVHERLDAGEQGLPRGPSSQGERPISASRRLGLAPSTANARRLSQGASKLGTPSSGSLEQAIGGLQRLANHEDLKRLPDRSHLQRAGSQGSRGSPPPPNASVRDASQASRGSQDENSWSTEVRALRSRLENIFQTGGGPQTDQLAHTGSSGLSGTVGSLPTVQEAPS